MNASSKENFTDSQDAFLRGLVELGLSPERHAEMQRLLRLYHKHSFSLEDCIELAFVRLRSYTAEIQCSPNYSKMLTEDETAPLATISLRQLEKLFFEQSGVLPPRLVVRPVEQESILRIKIHDTLYSLPLAADSPFYAVEDTLKEVLLSNAGLFVSLDTVEHSLARLHTTYPALVQAVVARFTLGEITRSLRSLVRKKRSIMDIRLLLEQQLEHIVAPSPTVPHGYRLFDGHTLTQQVVLTALPKFH